MKKLFFKKLTIYSLLIFSLAFLVGCSKNNISTEPLSRSEILMGTTISVTLYDNQDPAILDKVFDKVKELESTLSINENGTLIDKINEEAGKNPVKVDSDTYNLIKKGIEYSTISTGLFDISIGPIVKLWNIGLPEARVPSKEEINEKLSLIGYNDVVLNDKDETVFLVNEGMMLDLGGIAKGYTADVISDILSENNVTSAIIDLGGNIFAKGKKPNGDNWKIGIQNPLSDRGDIIGSISINNRSVVTSGIYERFIEQDGIRYHHILNPSTGYPYDNEIAGITIISDKSIDGDALSTSVFAMGVEEGLKFANANPSIETIFVTKDNKVYLSSGIKENFKLTNSDFILAN